jgi:hypothetical protein
MPKPKEGMPPLEESYFVNNTQKLDTGGGAEQAAVYAGGTRVSTRVQGAAVLVLVSAHASLSAGQVYLTLNVREGPAPGMWRYNLADNTARNRATGRLTGVTSHMGVLRHAASICAAGYEPGTAERELLEQFVDDMS